MKIEKRIISKLNKCYAITRLTYQGKPAFLVAAERHDPCYLFSEDGERLDTVWTEPGGVMSMTPVPGTENTFLAVHQFYSPDDSKEAKIVIAQKNEGEGWSIRTLCDAPFVHRFGILCRGGIQYLLVCCLKTGHAYDDDWRSPGALLGEGRRQARPSWLQNLPCRDTLFLPDMDTLMVYVESRRGFTCLTDNLQALDGNARLVRLELPAPGGFSQMICAYPENTPNPLAGSMADLCREALKE